jgi:hypothetical protein
VIDISTNARTLRIGMIGQSLAQFYRDGQAGETYVRALLTIAPATFFDSVEIANFASGGSYASEKNRAAEYKTTQLHDAVEADKIMRRGVLIDDTGRRLRAGSIMASSIAAMQTRATCDRIDHFLMDHGQTDVATARGGHGIAPAAAAQSWYDAWAYAIPRYRLNSAAGDVAATTVGVQIFGRYRNPHNRFGSERIRQKQLALIAKIPGLYRAAEVYDVELQDSIHPSSLGQQTMALRSAEMFALNVLDISSYTLPEGKRIDITPGPAVISCVKTSQTTATLVIDACNEELDYPETFPPWIKFGDAQSNFDQDFVPTTNPVPVIDGLSWSLVSHIGSVFTFAVVLAAPVAGELLLFAPYDDCPGLNGDNLIVGRTSRKPLQSWARLSNGAH